MTEAVDAHIAREALAELPDGTSHGATPEPRDVYLPRSHVKAMDPNASLVKGMRGAGKTFWWSALQNPEVRDLVRHHTQRPILSKETEVRTGFGVTPDIDSYPGKDVLQRLMSKDIDPRIIWRSVQAWQFCPEDHPIRATHTWEERVTYVIENPESIERLFQRRDAELDKQDVYALILFDALDRCADNWKDMYRAIRGLLQTATEMRSYRRLRVKIFLRSDQVVEAEIGDFPDASKILSSVVELNWPRRELYGMLWHYLANARNGEVFRRFLCDEESWKSSEIGKRHLFTVPRQLIIADDEKVQRSKFHDIAGQWMGRGPKRGFPYTWIPNHLTDTEGRVSPRSFLTALKTAAEDTKDSYPDHDRALHYDSIKRGVQEASKIRVSELREDYPWVDQVLNPLRGMVVPCDFDEIESRWDDDRIIKGLTEQVEQQEVKLPPRHIQDGVNGVREDIEALGVFLRMRDGRVNIPDVFRVGYGLGRRGGVRPVR